MDLSIGKLADVIGGQLCLGSLPPLGGADEPIAGRVATACSQACPGDVVFAGAGDGSRRSLPQLPDEAFARGALGVVAERHVEPWAGRFSMVVPDTRAALWELATWSRQLFEGTVIVAAGDKPNLLAGAVDDLLRPRFRGACGQAQPPESVSVPLSLLELANDLDYGIVPWQPVDDELAPQLAQLCAPDVAVLLPSHRRPGPTEAETMCVAAAHTELLAALPGEGYAVLDERLERIWATTGTATVPTLCVGVGRHCRVRTLRSATHPDALAVVVDGVRLRCTVPAGPRAPYLLAACAVARMSGFSLTDLEAALGEQLPPGEASGDTRAAA